MPQLCFEIKLTEICDCMMASLVNAAIYFGRPYAYLFKPVWAFGYRTSADDAEPFWKRLDTPLLEHPHDQLKKYHGIGVSHKKVDSFEEFLEDVKKEIENKRPVPIEYNAYHCPWAGVYQKAYLLHYSLIIGYNDRFDTFYCVDPYVTDKIVSFPIDELMLGFHHHYEFDLAEPICGTSQWRDDILEMLEHKRFGEGSASSYDMIRLLARDIQSSQKFLSEMRIQNDMYTYELFYQLKYMTHSRLNYGMFLRYIMETEKVSTLAPVTDLFSEASFLWRQVWLRFIKIIYLNNLDKAPGILKKICAGLDSIADLEEKCSDSLYEIVR